MKPRILFVDDEEYILKGLEILLFKQRHAWDMHFIQGGQQALDAFLEDPFDLVISDVRMPGLDGIQLVKRLKSTAPRTICLLLSGQIGEYSLNSLLEDGIVDNVINKPSSYQTLHDILSQCVDRIITLKQNTGTDTETNTDLQEE